MSFAGTIRLKVWLNVEGESAGSWRNQQANAPSTHHDVVKRKKDTTHDGSKDEEPCICCFRWQVSVLYSSLEAIRLTPGKPRSWESILIASTHSRRNNQIQLVYPTSTPEDGGSKLFSEIRKERTTCRLFGWHLRCHCWPST